MPKKQKSFNKKITGNLEDRRKLFDEAWALKLEQINKLPKSKLENIVSIRKYKKNAKNGLKKKYGIKGWTKTLEAAQKLDSSPVSEV